LLAKPLKLSKKFVVTGMEARSSGLSTGEKSLTAKASVGPPSATKSGAKKVSQASTEKDESGYVPAHVVNLVDVGINRRLLLGSIVDFCWDRPSALAGIDRRLLLGSTIGS
jgi:hypothetical protein